MTNDPKSGVRVLVAEHIPSFNRGESAIMHGLDKALRATRLNVAQLTVLSTDFDADRSAYGSFARVVDWRVSTSWKKTLSVLSMYLCGAIYQISERLAKLLFRGEFWGSFFDADLILVGHDSNLAGTRMLPWFLAVCRFARVTGKPIAIPAASIKGCGLTKRGLRHLLDNVDVVTLRDRGSEDFCSHLKLKNDRVFLTADLAFLMDAAPKDRGWAILEQLGLPTHCPLIGVTVCTDSGAFTHAFELYDEGRPRTHPAKLALHTSLLAQALDMIVDQLDAAIVFVPHCTGSDDYPTADDRKNAASVKAAMRRSERAFLLDGEYTGPELKAVLGRMAIVLGERMHSVVNALAMRVPALCISTASDTRTGIIRDMFGIDDFVYDIRDLKAGTLVRALTSIWHSREAYRRLLEEKLPEIEGASLRTGRLIVEHCLQEDAVSLAGS